MPHVTSQQLFRLRFPESDESEKKTYNSEREICVYTILPQSNILNSMANGYFFQDFSITHQMTWKIASTAILACTKTVEIKGNKIVDNKNIKKLELD